MHFCKKYIYIYIYIFFFDYKIIIMNIFSHKKTNKKKHITSLQEAFINPLELYELLL